MAMKNFLTHEPSLDSYELYHIHVKKYKKCLNKTKNIYTKKFHDQIRCLKTRNPKEFWKINKEESSIHSQDTSPIVFTDFIEHFKKLNKAPHLEESVPHLLNTSTNENINQPFSLEEVKFGINQLKVNKAGGSDIILNEFFKYCHCDCIPMIVDFLNVVLNTGCVPTEWCSGIIRPLYKNKGPITDPDNYRGITLLSCTSKLFTACLNRRLSRYVDDNILGKEQAGFRKGYSTTDHVFVLKHIIELYQSIHKRVYCAFIDYSKAFDTVDRALLWQKLLSLNIDGKFLMS